MVTILLPHKICSVIVKNLLGSLHKKWEGWLGTQIKRESKTERGGEDYCKIMLAFQTFSPVKTLPSSIVYAPGQGLSELCVSLDVVVASLNIHR